MTRSQYEATVMVSDGTRPRRINCPICGKWLMNTTMNVKLRKPKSGDQGHITYCRKCKQEYLLVEVNSA